MDFYIPRPQSRDRGHPKFVTSIKNHTVVLPAELASWSQRVHQAENENYQDDETYNGVESVLFESEAYDRQGDARNRRGNQEQKSELNQGFAVEVCGRLQNSPERLHDGAASCELVIIDSVCVVPRKVQNASREDRSRGKQNSGAKQIADAGFETPVVQCSTPFL
jgi:hypothetical protein